MRKNLDLRIEAIKSGVFLCRIAEALKMDRYTFYSDLRRRELTEPEKERVLQAIEGLTDG